MVCVPQVGFTKAGLIQALELDLYCNGGYALDISYFVGISMSGSAMSVYLIIIKYKHVFVRSRLYFVLYY